MRVKYINTIYVFYYHKYFYIILSLLGLQYSCIIDYKHFRGKPNGKPKVNRVNRSDIFVNRVNRVNRLFCKLSGSVGFNC